MATEPFRHAARRAGRVLATLGLCAGPALVTACQTLQEPAPETSVRAAPRHPIRQSPSWTVAPTAGADADGSTDGATDGGSGRMTPGPNSRVSPTPEMAPRVEPADRTASPSPSPSKELEGIRDDLRQQRERETPRSEPPKGTIKRPGSIKPPGTVDIPR